MAGVRDPAAAPLASTTAGEIRAISSATHKESESHKEKERGVMKLAGSLLASFPGDSSSWQRTSET